jgi:hypothetical protein
MTLALDKDENLGRTSSERTARRSLTAIDDEAVAQIIGRDGDTHAIARKHADVMTTHSTAKLRTDNRTTLVNLDVVLSATESVLNDAFHFEKITFTHFARAFS